MVTMSQAGPSSFSAATASAAAPSSSSSSSSFPSSSSSPSPSPAAAAASAPPTTSTSLPPTSTGFRFPTIHAFPPFFTVQPNPQTWASQSALWSQVILAWCQYHRRFWVDPDGAEEREGELFGRRSIDRRLSPKAIRAVLAQMVQAGTAEYEPPPSGKGKEPAGPALIYWRRPDEWGAMIYHWVVETGQNGTIMTFYELTEGDLASQTEFRNLPEQLLRRALDSLAKQGKAQVFRGTEAEGGDGVKFV